MLWGLLRLGDISSALCCGQSTSTAVTAPHLARFLLRPGEHRAAGEMSSVLLHQTITLENQQPFINHFRKHFTAFAGCSWAAVLVQRGQKGEESSSQDPTAAEVPPPPLGSGPSVLWKLCIFYSLCTTRHHRKGPSVKKPVTISQMHDNHDSHTLLNKDKPKKTPKANSLGDIWLQTQKMAVKQRWIPGRCSEQTPPSL